MQAISWTASQAATMAQVIPVIALALGLELREVRKFFDDLAPETPSGKHAAKQVDDEDPNVKTKENDEEDTAEEFFVRRNSRFFLVAFWGCLAMIVLMIGEQSSVAIVLGRSSYNNLNVESLAIRATLTIVFLSPAAQLVLSFMEARFRQKKTAVNKRYHFLGIAMILMTTVGFAFTFRGY